MARGAAAALGLVCLALAGCNAGVGGAPDASLPAAGGGVAGGAIGKALSPADQRAARAAEYKALEYGHTGVAVEVTPWRERHPVLAAPGVLWHVWRQRKAAQ